MRKMRGKRLAALKTSTRRERVMIILSPGARVSEARSDAPISRHTHRR